MIVVYKIESKINPGRCYIGSSIDYVNRKSQHLHELRNKKHPSIKLQNHYNKYGEEDLQFIIMRICQKDNLLWYEQFYINILSPFFNICMIAGNCLGVKHTKETREKLSKVRQGENNSFYGKHHTAETKRKISEAKKGSQASEETKKKMSLSQLGQKRSEEDKLRMSEAQKKIIRKPASEETKQLMSKSGRKAWMLRKQLKKELCLLPL